MNKSVVKKLRQELTEKYGRELTKNEFRRAKKMYLYIKKQP